MTTATDVAALEAAMRDSKASMMQALQAQQALLANASNDREKRDAIAEIHRAVTAHVNDVESSIAQDELTGANHNEQWRTYKAETALNLLESLPNVYGMIENLCDQAGEDVANYRPSRTAMASMQRLVAEVYPDDVEELRAALEARGLPVRGFQQAIQRAPAAGTTGASVQFSADGGLSSVNGVTSEDAAKIATGVAHSGTKGFSAPASTSAAADLVAKPSVAPTSNWFVAQWHELRTAPAKITTRVVAGIIVTIILILLTRWGLMPTKSAGAEEPNVDKNGHAATGEQQPRPVVVPVPPTTQPAQCNDFAVHADGDKRSGERSLKYSYCEEKLRDPTNAECGFALEGSSSNYTAKVWFKEGSKETRGKAGVAHRCDFIVSCCDKRPSP